MERIGNYWLCAPWNACDGGDTGWQIYTDDDGAPDELIAEFGYEVDARWFCAHRSETVLVSAA